ncbi:hypothetical protein GCM10011575_01710 [Microlunatus endophyticus]|uniref:Uncharacterized protein n=1 Tax=Microlunatus endophyticus TaxID=1716077 RepID=A0A917W0M8_9ACTN|nr:hypothetical protein [Microlunatus endophyticus]GGL47519.1 hypothetical protein GCM10011575_01710 [Microlunatus endophyticus]
MPQRTIRRALFRFIGSIIGIAVLLTVLLSMGSQFLIRYPGNATIYTVTITHYDEHTKRSCTTHTDSNGQSRTSCDDQTTYVLYFDDPRYPGRHHEVSVTDSWHGQTQRVFFDGRDWEIVWDLPVGLTFVILGGCVVVVAALGWFGIARPALRGAAERRAVARR